MSKKKDTEDPRGYTPPANLEAGFCQCGCGGLAPLAPRNEKRKGWSKGQPVKFIHGHNGPKGEASIFWKGGYQQKKIHSEGYVLIYAPDHPKAKQKGPYRYVFEHILICEKVLGKHLPLKAEPHHVDGNRPNNVNQNLVICQNRAYHMLLERRTRALKACGYASWQKCKYCHEYDDPINLNINGNYHKQCQAKYQRERYARKRSKPIYAPGF